MWNSVDRSQWKGKILKDDNVFDPARIEAIVSVNCFEIIYKYES
jgi:hypothetical protein